MAGNKDTVCRVRMVFYAEKTEDRIDLTVEYRIILSPVGPRDDGFECLCVQHKAPKNMVSMLYALFSKRQQVIFDRPEDGIDLISQLHQLLRAIARTFI